MRVRKSLRGALQTALATLAIGAVFVGGEARASLVVVPNAQAAAEGNDSNFGPFFSSSVRYQQVYSFSQFSTSGPLTISQIAFRPDGSVADPTLFIVGTSVQISLSTTSKAPGTLSTVFADNVGPNVQTVFNGFVSSAPVTGPGGGPKNFTVTITLDNTFVYDPSLGNLLLDVSATSSGISAPFDAQSGGSLTSHVDAPSIGATSGTVNATGLVTQFQFTSPPKTVWSQQYAFAWANQPTTAAYTPSTFYSYNHAGGNIQITRTATGAYSVQFASFDAFGVGGNVQVTAYGSSGGQYCKVESWSSDTAFVRCFDAAGAASDSYFTVLYIKAPAMPHAVAYAWASNPTSASYTPSSIYSYNPTGGAVTATRNGTGDYSMTWSGFGALGAGGGHPHVTAYDASNNRCQILSWGGDLVNVRCYDSAGNPADSRYSVLFVRPAATDDALAFAWANDSSSPSYTPIPYYRFNSGDGAVSATRTGVGLYTITFGGFSGSGFDGGDVQVTGYSATDKRCSVSSWAPETVFVRCYNAAGALVDTPYNVLFVKPLPEPAQVAMLASGVALLGLLARRRRH